MLVNSFALQLAPVIGWSLVMLVNSFALHHAPVTGWSLVMLVNSFAISYSCKHSQCIFMIQVLNIILYAATFRGAKTTEKINNTYIYKCGWLKRNFCKTATGCSLNQKYFMLLLTHPKYFVLVQKYFVSCCSPN